MSAPDYAHLLRLHAARWTVVFMGLAGVWVTAVCVSLGQGTPVPALVASAVCAASVWVCRIRYRQLLMAREDEALISMLRESREL